MAIDSLSFALSVALSFSSSRGALISVMGVRRSWAVLMKNFTAYLLKKQDEEDLVPQPDQPEEPQSPSPEEQAQATQQQATTLFATVRRWLEKN